jgi:hypothetical protein
VFEIPGPGGEIIAKMIIGTPWLSDLLPLLKVWDEQGFCYMANFRHRAYDASVCVLRHPSDELLL